jgi:hypothetical protein
MITGRALIYGLYPPWRDWCDWALDELDARGYSVTVTSGRRSSASQARLYNAWIAGRSTLPAAPPGRSAHEYGLGLDLVVVQGKASQQQRSMMNLLASWGGELVNGDIVHVQYPGFRALLSS